MTSTQSAVPSSVSTSRRIPCLDGLRAISILLVMYGHAKMTAGFPKASWLQSLNMGMPGTLGVCLFFIISGYLITTLILNEKERYGSISLRNFYIRRSLRIFPAFYLFLVITLILRKTGFTDFSNVGFISSATYWRNFFNGHEWILGHTWSLSVEEQFYLLWPLTTARLSNRKAILFALIIIAGWPLLRFIRHGFLFSGSGMRAFNTAAGDTILYGCLLALWTREGRTWHFLTRLAQYRTGLILSISMLVFAFLTCTRWPGQVTFILPIVRNLALTWLLWWCVCNATSGLGRVLEWKPVAFIGLISYSLYIWQQVFLFPDQKEWFCEFPINVVIALLAALISYRTVEMPFNRLRCRFSPVVSFTTENADTCSMVSKDIATVESNK